MTDPGRHEKTDDPHAGHLIDHHARHIIPYVSALFDRIQPLQLSPQSAFSTRPDRIVSFLSNTKPSELKKLTIRRQTARQGAAAIGHAIASTSASAAAKRPFSSGVPIVTRRQAGSPKEPQGRSSTPRRSIAS